MVFEEKNVSDAEWLTWIASGSAAMIIGLFIFVNSPVGAVIFLIGIAGFGIGYHRHNPFKGLTAREWWVGVWFIVAICLVLSVAKFLMG